MSEKNEETKAVDPKVLKMMTNNVPRHVTYTDDNGEKHTVDATVQDPGIGIAGQILDDTNIGDNEADYGEIFDLIMNNVLITPKYNYEILNNDLKKSEQTKTIKLKNRDDEEISLVLNFPGYRDALQIMMSSNKTNGGSNFMGTLATLTKSVIRDAQGHSIDMDFWDKGSKGDGIAISAYQQALEFLGGALNKDGLLYVLVDALQFCQTTLR